MKRQAISLLIVAVVLLAILMVGNPFSEAWFLKCPLHFITGYQCPLCGMQRQLHAIMHFDFAEAWTLNPVLMLCYPYLAILALSQVFNRVGESRIGKACNDNKCIFSFLAIMVLWGIVRNII